MKKHRWSTLDSNPGNDIKGTDESTELRQTSGQCYIASKSVNCNSRVLRTKIKLLIFSTIDLKITIVEALLATGRTTVYLINRGGGDPSRS